MAENNPFIKKIAPAWCPGCGDFGILEALSETLFEMGLTPQEVLAVSGIGQAAKLPHYIRAHGLNSLHGRALPAAMGAQAANSNLKIVLATGDGDAYSEGGNHLLHNIRRNLDLVHMVHDNQVYGLTKGQGSPTTPKGQKTSLQVEGMRPDPLNPLALAISLGCSFVARSFSGDKAHLKGILKAALEHPGYALVDILQPCVSFNKINTFKWYKDRVYSLPETYDPHDRDEAFRRAHEFGDDGIPIGVLYLNEKPTFIQRNDHIPHPLVAIPRSPSVILPLLEKLR